MNEKTNNWQLENWGERLGASKQEFIQIYGRSEEDDPFYQFVKEFHGE